MEAPMTTVTLIAALFSLALTLGVLWASPRRFSNQVYALITLIQATWLGCVFAAKRVAELSPPDIGEQTEAWLRANAAIIAFLPSSVWLLTIAIISGQSKINAIFKAAPLFVISIITTIVCYSDSFLYVDSIGVLQRGPTYYMYS